MGGRLNAPNPNWIRAVRNLGRLSRHDVAGADGGGVAAVVDEGPITGLLLARNRNVAATATAATTMALIM